ncbi:MAG: hypothetical protein ABI571_08170 [Actinomycetota bacterium]
MTEPTGEVGEETGHLMKASQVAAEEMLRKAEKQAAGILSQARRDAEAIKKEASVIARETIELLLLTAKAQRSDMLDEQDKQNRLIHDYERELLDQITVLQNILAKMKEKGERAPSSDPEDRSTNGFRELGSIWTDSEIADQGPRPVPFGDAEASGG